jgi:cold shock CspA family protein
MLRAMERGKEQSSSLSGFANDILFISNGFKQVLFRSAAREKILRGATQLADAVRVTLGPRSKSVFIEKKWGPPIVCNDGVTIAKEFDLKDPEENLGAQMLRQAAEKTGELVGDGTSTSTILAHAILADGLRNVVAGASAIEIKRGLDRVTKSTIDTLRALEGSPIGTVVRLDPSGEFGFIETGDGQEIYFHRNSVLDNAFSRLAGGSRVTYAEEAGNKGMQATTVTLLGKHGLRA